MDTEDKCQNCPSNCKECSSNTTCTACHDNEKLDENGVCIHSPPNSVSFQNGKLQCKVGFGVSAENKTCEPCPSNCKYCD